MRLGRIDSDGSWSDFVILRLLRRWAAVRSLGQNPLPSLVELASEMGEPAEVAIALHSVFELTESCLERPLVPECCCSPSMTSDERALLILIASAPARGLPFAPAAMPHGLPGALAWAATAARIALGRPTDAIQAACLNACPFELQSSDHRPPR